MGDIVTYIGIVIGLITSWLVSAPKSIYRAFMSCSLILLLIIGLSIITIRYFDTIKHLSEAQ